MNKKITRRNVLSNSLAGIGGLTALGLGTSAAQDQDLYVTSSIDRERSEEFSGVHPVRPILYDDYRGHMNSGLQLRKIIPGVGRQFVEYHTCMSTSIETKIAHIGDWENAQLTAGAGMQFNTLFDEHQVLRPQVDDNTDEWVGTSFKSGGSMSDDAEEKIRVIHDLIAPSIPYWSTFNRIDNFADSFSSVTGREKEDYDIVWGEIDTNPSGGGEAPNTWAKFLIEVKDEEENQIRGDVTNSLFGSALNNRDQSMPIVDYIEPASDRSSVDGPSKLGDQWNNEAITTKFTTGSKQAYKQAKKDLRAVGVDTGEIKKVYTPA